MADHDSPALPPHAAALGLALVASAALPLVGGHSFLAWLLYLLEEDPGAGLLLAITFGSPFLFGLAVASAGLIRSRMLAALLIKSALTFIHTTLVFAAVLALDSPDLTARIPFIGVALVSSLVFVGLHAEADAADRPLGPRWLARWGGTVLAATCAWLLLQRVDGEPLGPALHLHLGAAALLAVTVPRERRRQ